MRSRRPGKCPRISRGFALVASAVAFLALAISAAEAKEAQSGGSLGPPRPASPAAPGSPQAAASGSPAPLLPSASSSPTPKPERASLHLQTTSTQQYHGGFRAAYSGPQSLTARPDTAKTFDATLYLGVRTWKGGEFYVNPELDQGFGLGQPSPPGQPYSGTFGVAGFVSGEAYKVGRDSSYGRLQRIFVRQTVNLGGGEPQPVEPDINQLAWISTDHI
jgi:high affinity Mn2+ porin